MFFDIVEQLPIGIIVLNEKLEIVYLNQSVLVILGYSKAEVSGHGCIEHLLSDEIRTKLNSVCKNMFNNIDSLKVDTSIKNQDGEEISTSWKIVVRKSQDGSNCGIICYVEIIKECISVNEKPEKHDSNYVRLVEDGNDGIVILQDQKLKYFNNRLLGITGYNAEEALGKEFLDFVAPAYRDLVVSRYIKRMNGMEIPSTYEIEVISKEGKFIPMEITASTIEYDERIADLVILHDITKKKQTERELQEYSKKLFHSNELIKRKLDIERTISYVSSILVAPEDVTSAIEHTLEKIGLLCDASRTYLFSMNDYTTMSNTLEWCAQGVSSQKDNLQDLATDSFPWWMNKLQNRETIHVRDVSLMPPEASVEKDILEMQLIDSLIVLPIFSGGELSGFIGMDNVGDAKEWDKDDISVLGTLANLIGSATERKEHEEELDQYSSNLENAYENLKALDKMKDEFLANLNHELKTPMISIEGYSNLMHEGYMGELTEKQGMAIERIVNSSKRLGNLIDSLLYMGDALACKIEYDFCPVQMETVIDNSIRKFTQKTKERNIVLSKDIPKELPLIEGDTNSLLQLVNQLLDNAIKFSCECGSVKITAFEIEEGIRINIKDTGIGISKDKIADVFQSFYQVDGSSTRRYGGNGIGLYVSKKIIDTHNGSIWIESDEGMGTKVCITLPKKV
ncbi:PAS domain S-box protein [Methanolobus sp. ZRKC3]|uniref:PAS domain-containing sensor histidine kinase n=1 Tax=Methanolobus sp. ZRKC3 TaxID=3125786 RepID=UPI0032559F3F